MFYMRFTKNIRANSVCLALGLSFIWLGTRPNNDPQSYKVHYTGLMRAEDNRFSNRFKFDGGLSGTITANINAGSKPCSLRVEVTVTEQSMSSKAENIEISRQIKEAPGKCNEAKPKTGDLSVPK